MELLTENGVHTLHDLSKQQQQQQKDCVVALALTLRNLQTGPHSGYITLHSHSTLQEGSLFSTFCPAFYYL